MVVQNVDINVGPADYNTPGTLRVTKIFYTLQGEGPHGGKPAVFVRLAGCDRGDKRDCPFCDTYFDFNAGQIMPYDAIIDEMIICFPADVRPLVVITGGEPMLQNNLVGFIARLQVRYAGVPIQIESNGDRIPPGWIPTCAHVEIVVSPKVVKGVYRPLKPHIQSHVDVLKFVIDASPDSPYHNVPDWAEKQHSKSKIWLSPLTVYRRAVEKGEVPSAWDYTLIDYYSTSLNYRRVAKLCTERGYRASIQQHLFFGLE